MTLYMLAADISPRACKIIKNAIMFLKEEKICYKTVYKFLPLSEVNRVRIGLECQKKIMAENKAGM